MSIPYISMSFDNAKNLYNSLVNVRNSDNDPNNFSKTEAESAGNILTFVLDSTKPNKISVKALGKFIGNLKTILNIMGTGRKESISYFDDGVVEKLNDGTCRKVAGSMKYSEVGIAFYLYGEGPTFRAEIRSGDAAVGVKPVFEKIKCPGKKYSGSTLTI